MRVSSFPLSCNRGFTYAFFSFVVLIVSAALLSVPSLAPYPVHRPSRLVARPNNAPRAQRVSEGTPREIDFPYYSLREGYTSLLQLVSDSTVSLPIMLTVHSSSGRTALTKQMTIQSQEKLMIDLSTLLQTLGADNVDDFQERQHFRKLRLGYEADHGPDHRYKSLSRSGL